MMQPVVATCCFLTVFFFFFVCVCVCALPETRMLLGQRMRGGGCRKTLLKACPCHHPTAHSVIDICNLQAIIIIIIFFVAARIGH